MQMLAIAEKANYIIILSFMVSYRSLSLAFGVIKKTCKDYCFKNFKGCKAFRLGTTKTLNVIIIVLPVNSSLVLFLL